VDWSVVNIALVITSLIGFALAIWQTVRAEQLNRRQRDYDWPRLQAAAGRLAQNVDNSGFQPALMLASNPRGAIVAHLRIKAWAVGSRS
jgi:hypothetical protein